MHFENEVQEKTYDRTLELLRELFEEPTVNPDDGQFYVRYGSTVLEVSIEPYGPEEAIVVVMAFCVQAVRIEEDLLLALLDLNQRLPIGAFSLVDNDVFYSHAIFGRSLDRNSLLGSIAAVANIADEYDDRIVSKFGGQTASQRLAT